MTDRNATHARARTILMAMLLVAGTACSIAYAQKKAELGKHDQAQPEQAKPLEPAPPPSGPASARPIDTKSAVELAKERARKAQEARGARNPQDGVQGAQQGMPANMLQPNQGAGGPGAGGNNVVSRPGIGPARAIPVVQPLDQAQVGNKGLPGGNAGAAEKGMDGNADDRQFDAVEGDDELITLSDFREPVQLTTLVELVASTLQINISIKGDIAGAVTFNAPVPVKKSELIDLLDMLLEQQGWTIVKDRFGLYTILQSGEVRPAFATDRPTTRVFSTPNVRPSSLKPAIEAQLGGGGQPGQGGGGRQYTYLDELGVIVATDVPRRLSQLEEITTQLLKEFNRISYSRFDLRHISAPVARERALQLVGQLAQSSPLGQQGQVQPQQFNPQGGGAQNSLNNIGDRLTVDAQGNALVFRGRTEEIQHIRQILNLIDVPNTLVPKQYFAGSAARQIADIARGQGLGEVTTIDSISDSSAGQGFVPGRNFQQPGQAGGAASAFSVGGSVMVVDEQRGNIIYYATPEQQGRLDALIEELDTGSEIETIEVYKLKNSKAEDVAEVINNLLSNTQPVGEGSLLPDAGGAQRRSNFNRARPTDGAPAQASPESGLSLDSNAFVIADLANNQLLIKARAGQQPEFARLVEKLDLRRPQVYIEAMIVAVTTDDRTRLAFETQLINANGSGGVLNTNFGLGSFGTTGSEPILSRKTVGTGLAGFTAAIIKSDQVPIIMTALQNETDSRVISSPQLLVDDNEEANVVSLDQQPYSTTTLAGSNNTGSDTNVTFGGYAEAGTKLTVKPQISDAGYLRMEYSVELSSFTGDATGNLPPPKQTNNVDSTSITVPSDSTVVVGGLVVDADTKTVAKIPLIGDIPLLGYLFADTRTGDRKTTLYVFLTPRILRDPGFEDLRLLTRGPQANSRLPEDFPRLTPQMIDVNSSPSDFALPAAPVTSAPTPLPVVPSVEQRTNADGTVTRPVTRVTPPSRPTEDPLDPND